MSTIGTISTVEHTGNVVALVLGPLAVALIIGALWPWR